MTSPRIGLLGYGAIASLHARALAQLDCPLAAVIGPDPVQARQFADEHGVARATDALPDVLGAPDVDAVVVASPNDVHAEQTLAALAAGKHVLCEVPLALSYGDAERVAAAAIAADRQVMVCHTPRFWAPIRQLRQLVDDGELIVHHVIARTLIRRHENVGWTGRRRSWVDHLLWHQGSHLVDTALWLMTDEVEHVAAVAGRAQPATGFPMDVGLVVRTGSGALANLALSFNSLIEVSDLLVVGEDETFRIDAGSLGSSRGPVLAAAGEEAVMEAAIRVQDGEFVRALRTGTAARPGAADVLATYRVLQQASDRLMVDCQA
jgi:2-hydroxy-4-carboxymuconate semialdehyde hemiacetal dehydrogenase